MIHQIELEAIARTQCGGRPVTINLVDGLKNDDGGVMWGEVVKDDPDGIEIDLDAGQEAYGQLQTLLHECRHIQREAAGVHNLAAKQPPKVFDIWLKTFHENDELHGEVSETQYIAGVEKHYRGKHIEKEADCEAWSNIALLLGYQKGGRKLGGTIRWLASNPVPTGYDRESDSG